MPSQKELRDIAKELGIRKYSKMNKGELTEAIESHVQSTKAPPSEPKLVLKEPAEAKEVVRGTEERATKESVPKATKTARTSKSPWVKFCQEYSKENNVPYKEAMRQKDKYLSWKDKQSKAREEAKEE